MRTVMPTMMFRTLTLSLLAALLCVGAPAFAEDAGSSADIGESTLPDGGGEQPAPAPAPVDLPEMECGDIEFAGCCEGNTVFYCGDDKQLHAIDCGGNAVNNVCGMEGPFVNCVAAGAEAGPRCSSAPAPRDGATELPSAGDLAGQCPTLPTTLTLAPEYLDADGLPTGCTGHPLNLEIEVHQVGCSFTVTTITGEEDEPGIGQIDGRVVQLSYPQRASTITCLASIDEDDGGISGFCDGPWGFDDTACAWTYQAQLTWPEPEGGDGPDTVRDTVGGDNGTSGEEDCGGGGCAAGGSGQLAPLWLLLLLVAVLPRVRRSLR